MAQASKRLDTNVPGDFFVDSTCIDCDTCRWMAPETFDFAGEYSSVYHQPETGEEKRRALMAMLSCPTGSIGAAGKQPVKEAQAALPDPITEDVYHCGYHSERSFGAASYLITREGGNILVDSPRFVPALVRRIEDLGGVKTLFLTHIDDVADHEKFAAHFGCERIIHADDARRGAAGIERKIEGAGLVALDEEVTLIPVPGHTKGSVCLLYRGYLFTGDHLAWNDLLKHLKAFHSACWYDWAEQIRSMERLRNCEFEWVLPGHGRRCHLPAAQMRDSLEKCISWMKAQ